LQILEKEAGHLDRMIVSQIRSVQSPYAFMNRRFALADVAFAVRVGSGQQLIAYWERGSPGFVP
jgi:hypothetical protein